MAYPCKVEKDEEPHKVEAEDALVAEKSYNAKENDPNPAEEDEEAALDEPEEGVDQAEENDGPVESEEEDQVADSEEQDAVADPGDEGEMEENDSHSNPGRRRRSRRRYVYIRRRRYSRRRVFVFRRRRYSRRRIVFVYGNTFVLEHFEYYRVARRQSFTMKLLIIVLLGCALAVRGEQGDDEKALNDFENGPEQEDAFEDDEGMSQEELDAMADPDDLEAMEEESLSEKEPIVGTYCKYCSRLRMCYRISRRCTSGFIKKASRYCKYCSPKTYLNIIRSVRIRLPRIRVPVPRVRIRFRRWGGGRRRRRRRRRWG
eukprot:Seg1019.8 transcript_id=Seg1019.8/GoldUCD/mRNA.D3Y31 product="hypothetical protein" protein_id=Seg1019.8/GoldUCD/D3Y31